MPSPVSHVIDDPSHGLARDVQNVAAAVMLGCIHPCAAILLWRERILPRIRRLFARPPPARGLAARTGRLHATSRSALLLVAVLLSSGRAAFDLYGYAGRPSDVLSALIRLLLRGILLTLQIALALDVVRRSASLLFAAVDKRVALRVALAQLAAFGSIRHDSLVAVVQELSDVVGVSLDLTLPAVGLVAVPLVTATIDAPLDASGYRAADLVLHPPIARDVRQGALSRAKERARTGLRKVVDESDETGRGRLVSRIRGIDVRNRVTDVPDGLHDYATE